MGSETGTGTPEIMPGISASASIKFVDKIQKRACKIFRKILFVSKIDSFEHGLQHKWVGWSCISLLLLQPSNR